jgi:hypothetical protein
MTKPKDEQIKLSEEYTEVTNKQGIWKPVIGDYISGKIVKRQKSNFGESFVLETDDGEVLLPNHKVLENLLSRCYIGDTVRVECIGTTPSNKGHDIMLYKVFLRKVI